VHAVTPNGFEDTASILDLVSGLEIAVVPVGNQPGVVAISPDRTTAALGNTVDSSVSIVDIASATELRRVGGLGFLATLSINFENGSLGARFTQLALAGNGGRGLRRGRFRGGGRRRLGDGDQDDRGGRRRVRRGHRARSGREEGGGGRVQRLPRLEPGDERRVR
jgi:hypothetical protein